MKKLLLGLLLLPALAFGALSQPDLALLNAANLLKNAGFENGKANWTASGGTFTISSGNTTRVYGNSGGSWDSSASGQTLGSTYTVINSGGFSSQNGVGTCAVRCASGTCTHKLQVYYAGNPIAEQTIESSTVNFPRTVVNFVFPSSGDVTLRLISVAANEPQAYIDSCYLGRADGYNVFKSAALTNLTPYTPTFTGFGTPTGVEFYWARVGGHMVIKGKFTSGTSTGVEARITLPSGYTSADTTLVPSIRIVGKGVYNVVGAFEPSVLIEPSVDYMTFGIQDVSNAGLAKLTGSGTVSTGSTLSFFAELPIQGWNADADAVKADQTAQSWSGYHAQDCAFNRTNAAYGDPTGDASCTFTERLNTNFGTVTSFQESGNNGAGIVFSTNQLGRYLLCANTYVDITAADVANVELVDGSNNRLNEGEVYTNASGHVIPLTLCGIYNASTSGSHTLKLRTKSASGTTGLLANFSSSVEWNIVKISQSFPQPLVKNAVATSNPSVERLERYTIGPNSGGCTISSTTDVGAAGSSVATGKCLITFGTAFSAAPTCALNVYYTSGGTAGYIAIVDANTGVPTTTTVNIAGIDPLTTAYANADGYTMICVGPK